MLKKHAVLFSALIAGAIWSPARATPGPGRSFQTALSRCLDSGQIWQCNT